MVLKFGQQQNHMGKLIKIPIVGPHTQNSVLVKSVVEPRSLHFQQVLDDDDDEAAAANPGTTF